MATTALVAEPLTRSEVVMFHAAEVETATLLEEVREAKMDSTAQARGRAAIVAPPAQVLEAEVSAGEGVEAVEVEVDNHGD